MVSTDRDLDLKLRMQAVLWRLGYYTRIGVKLAASIDRTTRIDSNSRETHPSRKQSTQAELTDIDVLGIRCDADYTISYAVADCSTGRNRSPIARTFWLRGVMHYFHADRGYEVQSKASSPHQKEVADELGITLLDEESLQALEERYHKGQAPINIRLTDPQAYMYLENGLHQVDARLEPLLAYRDYRFWQSKPNRNLLNAISLVRRVNGGLDPSQKFQRILILDLLSLFSVAFLQACGVMFRTSTDNIYSALRTYIFGGTLAVQSREAMIRDFEKIVVSNMANQDRFPSEEELRKMLTLDPDYLPALADLAQRFVSKPAEAIAVPRYLQAIILERVLNEGNQLTDVFDDYSEITFKFVYDLAHFFRTSTGLSSEMFQDLNRV